MAQQKAVDPVVDEVDDLIDELQPGVKLLKGQYTITRYINSGGFGITYLAKDSLDRDVVIKECFPSSVCRRSKVMVAARSRAHTAELRSIVQLFVREARNLAKIVHPNIVSVHQVFEDNGTAYMALDFIDGLDLQQIIDGEGERPAPAEIVEITEKLIKAVGFIHQNDMLHRDISPDNVLIDKKGEPILIDFGAARDKASQTNRAMSALRVVKDGYSPQEFYIAGSEQGPWSDLYALGATLYHLISDEAPVNGQARLGALAEDRPDPYVPLTGRFAGFPVGFLEAIDRALCTLPKQRLQTADEWLAMFVGNPVVTAEPAPGTEAAVHRVVSDFQAEEAQAEPVVSEPVAAAKAASRPQPVAPVARRKSPLPMLAGGAFALAIAGGVYVMFGGSPTAPTSAEEVAQATGTATVSQGDAAAAQTAEAGTTTTDPAPETAAGTSTGTPEVTEAAPATDTAATTPEPTPAAEPTTDTATEPATETAAVSETAPAAAEPEAVAPEAETTAATDEQVLPVETAETAPEVAPEPAPEPSPVETAAAEPANPEPAPVETAAAEPEVAAAPAVDPEPAAEPEVAAPAPVGNPADMQVAFAAWDVELPFTANDRLVGGKSAAVIVRLSPTMDPETAGTWLRQGIVIHSINGTPTPSANALTTAILNAMKVDPDGRARMVADYTGQGGARETGLLTVDAVRLVSLSNGVTVRTSTVDGVWQSVVTDIAKPEMTSLRLGDVLFRDKSTGTALDGPTSLETIMAELVKAKAIQSEFSIVRNSTVDAATMQLVPAGTP